MEIFIAPRAGGKTTHIVEWALSTPASEMRVILVPNEQRKVSILKSFPQLHKSRVMTLNDYQASYFSQNLVLGVDELADVLYSLLRVPVALATVTDDTAPHDTL